MASKKVAEVIKLATKATTRPAKIRLNEIVMDHVRYCHRDHSALTEKNLHSLMVSITQESLQNLIEFFTDEQGRKILIKGHRRVTVLGLLAARNTPNYTADMEMNALEVVDATPRDLLLRSFADNDVREGFTRVERIQGVKLIYDEGISDSEAAHGIGMSLKNYERDLLIVKHRWMFDHVVNDNIDPTPASQLLEAAVKHGRLDALQAHLESWIADKQKEIREKEQQRKNQSKRDLPLREKQVKRKMRNHLVKHWLELIGEQKSLDDDAQRDFVICFDKADGHLRISAVNLNVYKEPVLTLAKVLGKLVAVVKQFTPVVRQLRQGERETASTEKPSSPYDCEYLREQGMEDLAEELEDQLQHKNDQPSEGTQEPGGPASMTPPGKTDQPEPVASPAPVQNPATGQGDSPGSLEQPKPAPKDSKGEQE